MTVMSPVLLALAYALGVRRVRRWPRGRSAAFAGGLVALLVAGGVHGWAERLQSVHMAEHMLICLVAAPLLAAGAPLTLALRALHGGARQTLAGVLRRARVIAHPVAGCLALTAALLALHLTPLYEARGLAHDAAHVVLMGAALWFWGPLLSREVGSAGRIAAVLALMAPMGALGAILLTAAPRFPAYERSAALAGVSPAADERTAAVLMWLGGGIVLTVALLLVAWHALWQEERRMRRREAVGAG
jgi:putative membrane protein